MFTIEKLKKWIEDLNYVLDIDFDEETFEEIEDLRNTLEKLYASMTSEGSI